jgi:hypothetical protein
MKLQHKPIPKEFLERIPDGLKYVLRGGHDHLVVEQAFCPKGHSLMAPDVRLLGEPSIKLLLSIGNSSGIMFLDAYWGSHDKLYNFIPDIASSSIVSASCPICNTSLIVQHRACRACGETRHIEIRLPGGHNRLLACAKLGCVEHEMIAVDFHPEIIGQVSDINYFGV